jgi:transcriptional regulator with XRE-family HTH domain
MTLEDIGERIRAARKARDLTQEALARRSDLSLNVVARLELGIITNPHYGTLQALAHSLGMTVGQLVEGQESAEELGRLARDLKDEWSRLGREILDRRATLTRKEHLRMLRRLEEIEHTIVEIRHKARQMREQLERDEAEGAFELAGAAG